MSHAQLYIADTLENAGLAEELFTQGADVEHFVLETLGINEARELSQRAYVRPSVRDTRDFLVSFSTITIEAQNALLKLLEEPPADTLFHIVVAREDLLISTLRSRLQVVSRSDVKTDLDVFKSFVNLSPGERMAEIASRTKAKDSTWMQALVAGVEVHAHTKLAKSETVSAASVVFLRQYFEARGASRKMLIEELALTL